MFEIIDLGDIFDIGDLLVGDEDIPWPFPFPPLPEPDGCGSYYPHT